MTASMQYATRSPSSETRWRDVARGGLAVLAILVLVVGVPIGLAIGVGWPLPHGVPSLSEIGDALRDSYIDDAVLVKALALICWIIWIELVVSLVLEAIAAARGRRAAHVPLAGGVQKMAARLVAAVLLLAVLAPGRGGPAKPSGSLQLKPPGPVVALVDNTDGGGWSNSWNGGLPTESAAADTLATSVGSPTYEVQRRDTLWDIAEKHLGDPFRWPEIYELNKGVAQADGTMLTNPDLIYVGWTLKMPSDAVGLPGVDVAPVSTAPAPAPAPTPATVPASDDDTAPPSDPNVMRVIDEEDLAVVGGNQTPVVPASSGGSETMIVLPDDAEVLIEAEPEPADDSATSALQKQTDR